ncbi:MAG: DNA repair protein RecO [Lachnospiraceae bacterium]|nr:DNA repair protein RecO [Lachnospiraceae bacterium]
MNNLVLVTGMILEVSPVNDYDRRVVILTKERGKITAFCRGARRLNNKMMAATNQFAFGQFKVYEGKNAYNLADAEISNYFEELRTDFEGAFLGMYFLEIASYYTRENNDETLMLKLLYQSVKAIIKESLDNRLVRSIYEIKSMVINGEFPGVKETVRISETVRYAIDFITTSSIEKLYTFTLAEEAIVELAAFSFDTLKKHTDRTFKSLELLIN